jgi:hypothetical protein
MPETWQSGHAASLRRQLRIFFRLINDLKVCCRSSIGAPAEPCGYGTTRREPRLGAGVHLVGAFGRTDGTAIACSGPPPCSSDRSLPAAVALRAARCHPRPWRAFHQFQRLHDWAMAIVVRPELQWLSRQPRLDPQ